MTSFSIYHVLHLPKYFAARTAFVPLVEKLEATPVYYDIAWEKVAEKSWTLSHLLRRAGIAYYGSAWNALVPVWDELKMARAMSAAGPRIVHFLYGDFATPRSRRLFRRKQDRLIGTFHASQRKQPSVLLPRLDLRVYDFLTVVSETEIPFLVSRGFPAERIRTIPLGVDTDFFRPDPAWKPFAGSIRAILVGSTERDHAFAAEVMRRLPAGCVTLSVATSREQQAHYRNVPGVSILPWLSDEELVKAYQQAELLFMPMLDCTANDAILEAMACGTPVMANRVGGIPEYVDASSAFTFESKNADEWAEVLQSLMKQRERLAAMRSDVRRWAERFGWNVLAGRYYALYQEAFEQP